MRFFRRPTPLVPGDPAPIFSALDQDGVTVEMEAVYAKGPALFFFYVRAGTPLCTAHACRLRDGFEKLQGIQVFGVSNDPPARLQKFAQSHHFPYRLLSDCAGQIAEAFHVPIFLGFPARSAFLVRDGQIAQLGRAGNALNLLPGL